MSIFLLKYGIFPVVFQLADDASSYVYIYIYIYTGQPKTLDAINTSEIYENVSNYKKLLGKYVKCSVCNENM